MNISNNSSTHLGDTLTRKLRCREVKIVSVAEDQTQYRLVDTPDVAASYWRSHIAPSSWYSPEREHFVVLNLNTRKRVIFHHLVGIGILDQCLAHAREIFRAAIVGNAHSVLLMHNHPSDDPTPSDSDVQFTREIIKCGRMLRIEVVDHVVVTTTGNVSLRSLGLWM